MEDFQRIDTKEVDSIEDGIAVWIYTDHQGDAIASISTNIAGAMSDSLPDAVQ